MLRVLNFLIYSQRQFLGANRQRMQPLAPVVESFLLAGFSSYGGS
jgi:hypothetical protein